MIKIEPFIGGSNKQRLIDCIRGKPVDRVPNLEVLLEEKHVEKLLGRYAGNTMGIGGDPAKGNASAEQTLRPMYPKDSLEICRIIGQDAMILEATWTPFKHRLVDGTIAPITDRSIKTKEDIASIIWPTEADLEERLRYVREYVRAAQGTNIAVMLSGFCIFQTLYEFVIGLHDCMIMLMEDRDTFEYLMRRSADYFAELVRRAIKEGVDIVGAGDDFAFKSGLFVRPELFEEIWRPHFDRILAPARDAGAPILFHSDGKIDDAVEMLLDMGIECITPMDPSGIDYRDYKKRFGRRVSLHGNIDLTWPLSSGTPQDVEKDVKAHMDVLKPGGRWIAGSSHSIGNFIPHENFIAMINAIHNYGVY